MIKSKTDRSRLRPLKLPTARPGNREQGQHRLARFHASTRLARSVEVSGSTGSHAQQVVHAAQQSFVDGWQQAMWAGGTVRLHRPARPEERLLAELELRDVIEEMTRDLLTEYSAAPPDTDEWQVRYPPW